MSINSEGWTSSCSRGGYRNHRGEMRYDWSAHPQSFPVDKSRGHLEPLSHLSFQWSPFPHPSQGSVLEEPEWKTFNTWSPLGLTIIQVGRTSIFRWNGSAMSSLGIVCVRMWLWEREVRCKWELAVKTVEGEVLGWVWRQAEQLPQVHKGHGGIWISGDLPQ